MHSIDYEAWEIPNKGHRRKIGTLLTPIVHGKGQRRGIPFQCQISTYFHKSRKSQIAEDCHKL